MDVQVGNHDGIELDTVGSWFEPYRWRPCVVTWDVVPEQSRMSRGNKLRRTSLAPSFSVLVKIVYGSMALGVLVKLVPLRPPKRPQRHSGCQVCECPGGPAVGMHGMPVGGSASGAECGGAVHGLIQGLGGRERCDKSPT